MRYVVIKIVINNSLKYKHTHINVYTFKKKIGVKAAAARINTTLTRIKYFILNASSQQHRTLER